MQPEISSNGRTVWVNGSICLGRFCPISGEVMVEGWLSTMEPDWDTWRDAMFHTWKVQIGNEWKPEWVKK